jgi:hypothetical protein
MDVRPRAIKKGGLQQLHQFLFSSSLQPLFIAIDFERPGWIMNNFSHARILKLACPSLTFEILPKRGFKATNLQLRDWIGFVLRRIYEKVSLGVFRDLPKYDAKVHR